ncbi:MAG TPA: hypothetical protein VGJ95_02100 [Pseudonocardiaceae bacterium]
MTVEDPVAAPGTVADPPGPAGRRPPRVSRPVAVLRFVSGTLTAGLLALAAAVTAAALFSGARPGPGASAVAGHAVVAVTALVLQLIVDRRRGPLAAVAALLIVPLAAATLWLWWWN